MKTPVSYKINLQHGIITDEMLECCLLGVNKRAKNCRNAIRNLNKDNDYGHYRQQKQKYTEKLCRYYDLKYRLLSVLQPIAIHYETYNGNGCKVEKGRQRKYADYDRYNDTTTYFYLFFTTKNHSYHCPIAKDDVQQYPQLPKIFIKDHIVTDGMEEEQMLPMEFIMDVVQKIDKCQIKTESYA